MFAWKPGDLNPEQVDAIQTDGSVFLVACPGSGKTRTLTYKAAYELSRLTSERQFIVAITYTHRAADEIHERIEQLGVDTSHLWIGTIHSFCLEWILKPYAIYHSKLRHGFRVINPHDTEKLFTELCEPYNSENITAWDCGYHIAKGKLVFECQSESKYPSLKAIFKAYFQTLSANRQIDFELMLHYAHQLIERHPPISSLLSNLFPHILIDEYQDTKEIQYSIVASILRAGRGRSRVFIVGDPNQAIYKSLGGFAMEANDFGALANIPLTNKKLSKNYRSSERIVNYFGNFNIHDTEIVPESREKAYPSLISFNQTVTRAGLEDELIRLIRYSIETRGFAPHEVCVLAPQWVHLASMTRRLVASLPDYSFDGPGMVPFSRDIDNFWYKVSKIALTQASPQMYVRRLRWARDVLRDLEGAGVDVSGITSKLLLRQCNSISLAETDGLKYLETFFDALFSRLEVDFRVVPYLKEHHEAFFESSQVRIERLRRDGAQFIADIATFRKVFGERNGITVSTIHGVKGAEFDVVIAYALLEGMVPHFNDADGQASAARLLYVICSRARKDLHLISERERPRRGRTVYEPTTRLANCHYTYDTVP